MSSPIHSNPPSSQHPAPGPDRSPSLRAKVVGKPDLPHLKAMSKTDWVCQRCFATQTPQRRGGPDGPRTLCNACGLKYSVKKRREDSIRDKSDASGSKVLSEAVSQPNVSSEPNASSNQREVIPSTFLVNVDQRILPLLQSHGFALYQIVPFLPPILTLQIPPNIAKIFPKSSSIQKEHDQFPE